MKIAVILPAAGAGRRFTEAGGPARGSKVELDLAGKPVFLRAVELFLRRPTIVQILLAVRPESVDDFRFRWGDKLAFHGVQVVPGGQAERWETVLRALEKVRADCTHVAIHDAARPMTSAKLIDRLLAAAEKHPAVIPGLPVSNTLKRVAPVARPATDHDPLDAILGSAGKLEVQVQRVVETVDRSQLVEIQTPQVFEVGLLRRAYAQIAEGKLRGQGITDDAGLVEALGQEVFVVEGEATNLKVTRPDDLALAAAFAAAHEATQAAQMARKRLFTEEDV